MTTYNLEDDILTIMTEAVQDGKITESTAEELIILLEAMLRFNEPFEV